jgi:hypothetical protein
MKENLSLFEFELSAEEVASIYALGRGEAGRIGPHPDTFAWIPEPQALTPGAYSLGSKQVHATAMPRAVLWAVPRAGGDTARDREGRGW